MKNHLLEETLTKRNKLFEFIEHENAALKADVQALRVRLAILQDELDIKELKLLETNVSAADIRALPVDTLRKRVAFLSALLAKYKRQRGAAVSTIVDHFRAAVASRASVSQESRFTCTPMFAQDKQAIEADCRDKRVSNAPKLFADSADSDSLAVRRQGPGVRSSVQTLGGPAGGN